MPRQNRAYKKGTPHRDARLFIIVAEGVREDNYFAWFHERNQRINVEIVERTENRSAPKHFLERIEKFIDSTGWSQKDNDQLWMVLDVDRWSRDSIDSLAITVQASQNWFIAISNPCFEVWLHYHISQTISEEFDSCTKLKQNLNQVVNGGYKVENFAPRIREACSNASAADNSNGYFPDHLKTKLYQLGNEIAPLLGNNSS